MTLPMVLVAVLVLGGLLIAVIASVREAQVKSAERQDADRAWRSLAGEYQPIFVGRQIHSPAASESRR